MADFMAQTQTAIVALFTKHFNEAPSSTQVLHSAGSNRVYLRLTRADGTSVVGAFGSNIAENDAFVYLAQHFKAKELPVPEIYAVSDDHLCYLQTDLGDVSLHQTLSSWKETGYALADDSTKKTCEYELLCSTLRLLAKTQVLGGKNIAPQSMLPPVSFDQRAVMFDLHYFKYCFLKPISLPFDEMALEDDFEKLVSDLLHCDHYGTTFLYRDFQARNVMVRDGQPWWIDFQSGRIGPPHYDVASFLWQASAQYPDTLRRSLVKVYLEELASLTEIVPATFRSELQLFVLFRMLQVLGAYGLRGLYERKPYFLQSIPLALRQIRQLLAQDVVADYPTLAQILQQLTELPQFL